MYREKDMTFYCILRISIDSYEVIHLMNVKKIHKWCQNEPRTVGIL